MTTAEHQETPFFDDINPETSIRIQDEAVIKWLENIRFRSQAPKVVTAWQSKAFSQKKELHSDETQKTPISLPMIAVSVGSIVPDTTRRQVNNIRTFKDTGRIYENDDKDFVYEIPWPIPISIPYQIDIWTKTRQDLRALETAIISRFSYVDMMYLKATFKGIGEQFLRITLDSVDDTSDLETGENERELRKTISTTMDGWIFRKPIKRRTIQKGHVAIIDAGTDPDNLLDGSDFLDHYCDIDNYNFNSDYSEITSVTESLDFSPPDRVLAWASFDDTGLVGTGP